MEAKHLSYLGVDNFKKFDFLDITNIGQFNLIVGDNNVGRTTLLEALLFDKNYEQCSKNLANALLYNRKIKPTEDKNFLDFYLNVKKKPVKFLFKYNDNDNESLTLSGAVLNDLTDEQLASLGGIWAAKQSNTRHLIKFELRKTTSVTDTNFSYASMPYILDEEWGSPPTNTIGDFPFIGFNIDYNQDIVNFSKISISTTKLENIKKELKSFIPNLMSIEINNAIVPGSSVIAIREANADLQPLSQYGDGTVKLFRYLLEMESCENKRLMIDEIDTGIHYSRMKDFLEKVMQTASNKNVQIFATTHSKECIEYYTRALEDLKMQDKGRIIRLADTKSGIKAYTMNYAEFENSLFAESEIR